MSFRDHYNNYYWTEKYYEDRELQQAVSRGFDDTAETQRRMLGALARKFDKGIERIAGAQADAAGIVAASNRQAAAFVGDELRHMSEALEASSRESAEETQAAIDRSADRIDLSIQDAASFLGLGLSKISWNIEQLTEVSRATLEVLTESLSNESRQLLEQGRICFEKDECAISRELFERALEANRLNFIAYEYLGFVGIEEDDPAYARRQFELAVKFAPPGYHKAIALSHLARCFFATDERNRAEELQAEAVAEDESQSWLWYELARYRALLGRGEEACAALRSAIKRDWKRWALAVVDEGFDPIRQEVSALLAAMKKEALLGAHESIGELEQTMAEGRALGVDAASDHLDSARELTTRDNVYSFLEAREIVEKDRNRLFDLFERVLEERIEQERSDLAMIEKEESSRVEEVNRAMAEKRREIARETSEKRSRLSSEAAEADADGKEFGCATIFAIPILLVAAIWNMVRVSKKLDASGIDALHFFLSLPTAVAVFLIILGISKLGVMGKAHRLRKAMPGREDELDRAQADLERDLEKERIELVSKIGMQYGKRLDEKRDRIRDLEGKLAALRERTDLSSGAAS